MTDATLPDAPQRRRIRTDLETNLLVEAGAGSGKTTELLERMVALIASGTARAEQIAAVTFTRKAAAELRERFQTRLEEALREARRDGDPEGVSLLDDAVREIDRGFIGTIHAFCARLLRERPIEAGLDPSFRELFGPEEERLRRESWHRFIERLTADGDPALARLAELDLEHLRLQGAYATVVDHPDVDFAADEVEAPDVGPLRDRLEELLDEGREILPEREPEKSWDSLQKRLRELERSRFAGWDGDARFLDALGGLLGRSFKVTLNRWGPHAERARALGHALDELMEPGGLADTVARQWHAHRYPDVMGFVQRAARAFERDRLRRGRLTFNDLLMRAAGLLRHHTGARRDLGERYRYLLVDEFQDTDPVQAELVFLLTATDAGLDDWRRATPRPGSLFVVGDPKQSIYRFRRADIAIYKQVKDRFLEFGDVVELTANFRSHEPLQELVNGAFPGLLPAEDTEHQAAFAPMDVQKQDVPHQGVYWYEVPASSWGQDAVAAADAPLVGSWIAARIESGERRAGDFLVLTLRKAVLAVYAAELERRNVPVQVTGAGVDIGDELDELVTLLQALATPDDPVLTVAALTGRFSGVDLDALTTHRLAGGSFRLDVPWDEPSSPVEEGLARLNRWWRLTRRLPADLAVAQIVDQIGLLPYLAAGDLGESNAGALAYAVDAVRRAGLAGDCSLQAAVDALQEALLAEDVEAPLQPGRQNVVRVMNLHKAKGLQAPVVVLAHPTGRSEIPPDHTVERGGSGAPRGHLVVEYRTGPWGRYNVRLAAPAGWDDLAARERPYLDAEEVRLLYVATTRAEEELVVSRCTKSENRSPWQELHPHLGELATELELAPHPPPARETLETPADEIVGAARALGRERARAAEPGYEIVAVTRLAGDDDLFKVDTGGRGSAWGNAVHQALEAAGRGIGGARLRSVCRTALLENDLPVDRHGEPRDLDDLTTLVTAVLASDTWERAARAHRRLVEAPFALREEGPPPRVVEGVVDLAFQEDGGWVIADYKTDVIEDADLLALRLEHYRAQVDRYASCWERLTGESVKERRILLVGMERDDVVW